MRVKVTALSELTLQMFDAKSRCALLCYAIVCLASKLFIFCNKVLILVLFVAAASIGRCANVAP